MNLDGYFVSRCMVYSREEVNGESAIDTLLDIQLTANDLQTLPLEELREYFLANPEEFTKRISFENWENASHTKDEEMKKMIIESFLHDEKMETVFERLEDVFESIRFCQKAIENKQYKIEPLSDKEIEVIIDGEYGEEVFLIETKKDGEEIYVSYFAFYVDEEAEPVTFFDFLPEALEKAFFDDVLNHINKDSE
jgi:hypothetical protein